MKVGEYIRTKDGIIDKVIIEYNGKCASPTCNCKHVSCEKNYYDEDKIIKSSPNIIDLIKEHDLLRLYDVEYGEEYITEVVIDSVDMLSVSNYDCDNFLHLVQELMTNEHIKLISIVTSEQFSQMEYRIGE